jgi:homoserine O-acetyltransferase/O-succinyltransferase
MHNDQTKFVKLYDEDSPLLLESGSKLSPVNVAYETYGRLNSEGTNAILVCHALTANAHAGGQKGWWEEMIGPARALDTQKYFVVCSNILGSCYGTTGPTSVNPVTGKAYGITFPEFTVRDIVKTQKRLLDHLGINRLTTVIGSSLGGMQVLEWAILYPEFCETMIPISVAAKQPAWCIAFNCAARSAIMSDPEWNDGDYEQQPARGLALARMIGMISYRSPEEFEERFGQRGRFHPSKRFQTDNAFEIEKYLQHHGKKLVDRFDANTYLYLTRAMDLHDIGHGRGKNLDVLGNIGIDALCVGVTTDVRYPISHTRELSKQIPNAIYAEIESIHGHDAFLIEFKQLGLIVNRFLSSRRTEKPSSQRQRSSSWHGARDESRTYKAQLRTKRKFNLV